MPLGRDFPSLRPVHLSSSPPAPGPAPLGFARLVLLHVEAFPGGTVALGRRSASGAALPLAARKDRGFSSWAAGRADARPQDLRFALVGLLVPQSKC